MTPRAEHASLPLCQTPFLRDVLAGLARAPRRLPCKYFYDAAGSSLFDRICTLAASELPGSVRVTALAAKLDVSGTGIFRGLLSLPATGTATATAGKNSQPLNFTASAFKTGTGR